MVNIKMNINDGWFYGGLNSNQFQILPHSNPIIQIDLISSISIRTETMSTVKATITIEFVSLKY